MTEAEILAELHRLNANQDRNAPRIPAQLRYDELPPTLQAMADNRFTAEQVYHFLNDNAKRIVEVAEQQHTEVDSNLRRIAAMQLATFQTRFEDFKRVIVYYVEMITAYRRDAAGQPVREEELRINFTADQAFRAVSAMYHMASRKDRAEAAGVITRIDPNIYIITDAEYRDAFTFSTPESTGPRIVGVPNFSTDVTKLFDVEGKATAMGAAILQRNKGQFTRVECDLSLIQSNYSIILDNPEIIKNGCIFKVSRSALCRHLGIRPSNRRRLKAPEAGADTPDGAKRIDVIAEAGLYDETGADLESRYRQTKDCVGVLPDGSWYYLLQLRGYDSATDSYEVSAPYLAHVAEAMLQKQQAAPARQRSNPHYGHSTLVHGTIFKCRNEAAKAILEFLIIQMHRRGETNQEGEAGKRTVSYTISCQKIVESVGLLSDRLAEVTTLARRNQLLRRAFSGVIDPKTGKDLFREHTDAYTYFKDLRITWVIPDMDTLQTSKITMRWRPQKES